MRRLIINADDFGLTDGVNRAIGEAFQAGIVGSTTAMANGPALAGAIKIAQASPGLGTGCHVVLVDGTPVLAPGKIKSLVVGSAGRFRASISQLARAALAGRLHPQDVKAETAAQIERLQSAGMGITHCDTHKHAHCFPAILRPLLEAAWDCGVRAVRNPFEPAGSNMRGAPLLRRVEVRALATFRAHFLREAARVGMKHPDGAFGIAHTGALDLGSFARIAAAIPDGVWELVCHPGYNDEELNRAGTRLLASRERELALLCSAEARDILHRYKIETISFRELAES